MGCSEQGCFLQDQFKFSKTQQNSDSNLFKEIFSFLVVLVGFCACAKKLFALSIFLNSFQSSDVSRKCKLLMWLASIWHSAFSLCMCKLVHPLPHTWLQASNKFQCVPTEAPFPPIFTNLPWDSLAWVLDNCITISVGSPVNFYTKSPLYLLTLRALNVNLV